MIDMQEYHCNHLYHCDRNKLYYEIELNGLRHIQITNINIEFKERTESGIPFTYTLHYPLPIKLSVIEKAFRRKDKLSKV